MKDPKGTNKGPKRDQNDQRRTKRYKKDQKAPISDKKGVQATFNAS